MDNREIDSHFLNNNHFTQFHQSDKSKKIPQPIGIKILSQPETLTSEKTLASLRLSIKIIFAPVTILLYLITKSLSAFASSKGLGTDIQTRRIDYNSRDKLIAMEGEEIKFGLSGGAILEGMFFETDTPDSNPKTILLCTGSHRSYEQYAIPMVTSLKSMGHNVMVFNYEGFGKSEGSRSEEGVYRSVEAAYQYLKQEKNSSDDSIVGWGYSLGSGAVSDLASKHEINIVIDRGFSSMSEVAYQCAPIGLKTLAKIIFMVGAHFNNISKLAKAQGNVFVAQGKMDRIMVIGKHGEKMKEIIYGNSKNIYLEVDCDHYHYSDVWFDKDPDRIAISNFLNQ